MNIKNKLLTISLFIGVLLFVSAIFFVDVDVKIPEFIKILLSILLGTDSVLIFVCTVLTYNKYSWDDIFNGHRFEIFSFSIIMLLLAVIIWL